MSIDPFLFRPEAIEPETAAFNADLEKLLATQPPPNTLGVDVVREARKTGTSFRPAPVYSPSAKERVLDGPGGALTLRCFMPSQPDSEVRGVYLHIHGGGWALGTADSQDPRLEQIAERCSLAVLSVEYRLAPEDPYPAGPDDCEAAALWLVENAQSEFSTSRLLIGGESAGAHLAVVTLARLRDRHGLQPFAGANLAYGVYDLNGTPSVARWGERYLILSQPIMQWFGDMYVAAERRMEPDVSPMYADLSGLPPALFQVGTMDPLLDDTLFLYTRWLTAGNQAELGVYPGGVHGFPSYPIGIGRRAQAREEAFLGTTGIRA